jgi:hypothetical protein
LDRVEINGALAAEPLAVMKELDLPADIVNVRSRTVTLSVQQAPYWLRGSRTRCAAMHCGVVSSRYA